MGPDPDHIGALIAALDGDDTNRAEEAQAELESYGAVVLDPLIEAAPGFGRFGQLCAIELFAAIGDVRAGPVLIAMLRSRHDTVVEWAADALGGLGVRAAVPELRRAYEALDIPLDWSAPVRLREALTRLGAREEVVPERIAALAVTDEQFERCWPVAALPEVIAALADARQLVLFFQLWQRYGDSYIGLDSPGWELDWSLPWPALVEAARADALAAAREAESPPDTVATVTWMDERDRLRGQ